MTTTTKEQFINELDHIIIDTILELWYESKYENAEQMIFDRAKEEAYPILYLLNKNKLYSKLETAFRLKKETQ